MRLLSTCSLLLVAAIFVDVASGCSDVAASDGGAAADADAGDDFRGDAATTDAGDARDGVADAGADTDGAVHHTLNWRPGNRFFVGGAFEFHGLADAFSSMDALVAQDPKNKILGFEVAFMWSQLESQDGGLYDGSWDSTGNSGFAAVEALIAHVKAYDPPRDLSIQINSSGNGQSGYSSFPTYYVPQYLDNTKYGPVSGNNRGGVYCGTGVGPITRFWNAAVVEKMVALGTAYGTKFGADIYRWDPIMEMSIALPGEAGFSDTAEISAIGDLAAGLRAGLPHSLILLRPTFLMYNTDYPAWFAAVMPHQISIGNYDSTGEGGQYGRYVWGDLAYRGEMNNGPADSYGHATPIHQSGWVDYLSAGYDFHTYTNADELGARPNYDAPLPGARVGSGFLPDIVSHDAQQHTSHKYWYANGYAGPNCNRTSFTSKAPPNPAPPNGPGGGVVAHPNLVDFVEDWDVPDTAYPAAWH